MGIRRPTSSRAVTAIAGGWLPLLPIAHRKDLMEKVCVARDEECGVYGFVFQRDGEWVSTVVDDNLYLEYADFDQYGRHIRRNWTASS